MRRKLCSLNSFQKILKALRSFGGLCFYSSFFGGSGGGGGGGGGGGIGFLGCFGGRTKLGLVIFCGSVGFSTIITLGGGGGGGNGCFLL